MRAWRLASKSSTRLRRCCDLFFVLRGGTDHSGCALARLFKTTRLESRLIARWMGLNPVPFPSANRGSMGSAYGPIPACRLRPVPRARSDIANTALRIFLQEMGAAYDEERGRSPYNGRRDFSEIREFFNGQCCYCGTEFSASAPANQDHLIPMNKADLGLHAWGNVVPACQACNNARQRRDWRDYIIERAGARAEERHSRVRAFLADYGYDPNLDLRSTAEALYEEVGGVAMTLIETKIRRVRERL
jgi:5-methylcytosine-specific restriction endonuclease McrA